MIIQNMLRLFTFHISLLTFVFCAFSQGNESGDDFIPVNKEVKHSTVFGVMGMNEVYDSYISPYAFNDGVDFRVQRETARMTKLWGGRVSNQSFIDANVSSDLMTEGGPEWYTAGLRYGQGWLYNFHDCNVVNPAEHSARKWNYAAGLQASGYLGGVYYDRSGNNPGQIKFDVTVNATGILAYTIHRRKHRPIVLSYQLTFPLMGIAFSPNYGQSYYEIFELDNNDHNAVFVNTFNMPSNRHRFLVDIPIRRGELRLGYDVQINQAKINNLEYYNHSIDFVIGFTKYFTRR